jgi:hypothetical protein
MAGQPLPPQANNVLKDLMSRMRNVLCFRKLVMMMRLCVRNSRCGHCSNDKNCKEFLQKIVHEANLISESLTRSLQAHCNTPAQCSAANPQPEMVDNACRESVVLLPTSTNDATSAASLAALFYRFPHR